jgi:ABC-type glutathione transport system ATPase component
VGPVIAVDNLTVSYRSHLDARQSHVALRDISLSVQQGERIALIGESGSGKSSFALAVAGVGKISSGTVRVLDETLSKENPVLRRRRPDVQMIMQDPYSSLDPRQTIGAGLFEVRRLHPQRTAWIDVNGLLELVALRENLRGRYPHELSGGQLQRVGIARALFLQPKVLIADEPTSALDVSVQAQILKLMAELQKKLGITLITVTHHLAVVDRVADRVFVLQRGDLVEHGPVASVLHRPTKPYTKALLNALPGRTLAEYRAARPTGTPLSSSPDSNKGQPH